MVCSGITALLAVSIQKFIVLSSRDRCPFTLSPWNVEPLCIAGFTGFCKSHSVYSVNSLKTEESHALHVWFRTLPGHSLMRFAERHSICRHRRTAAQDKAGPNLFGLGWPK